MEGRLFPEDLMSEILLRLPIFCLVRFRCVCKSWYSLLSDPKFLYKTLFLVENDHRRDDTKILVKLKLKPADPFLYCSLSYDSLQVEIPCRDFPVDLGIRKPNPNYKHPGWIMSACGGLLCLAYFAGCAGADDHTNALFNPATSEIKVLPPPLHLPFSEYGLTWTTTGFGFDQQTNDYKVVRIRRVYRRADSCYLNLIHVCSMGDDSWRELDDSVGMVLPPHPHFRLYGLELPQYCPRARLSGGKGKCFWAGRNADYAECHKTITIVSFDMSSQVFQVGKTLPILAAVGIMSVNGFHPCVFMLKDETVAIYHCVGAYDHAEPKMDIWVLQQFGTAGECWYKLFSISISISPSPSPCIQMGPRGLSKHGKVICVTRDDRLLVLDPTTGQTYALPVGGCHHFVQVVSYVPSVLPLSHWK